MDGAWWAMGTVKRQETGEVPGGLVVRISGFYCRGPGSIPGLGTESPHQADACHGQKKKKKVKNKKRDNINSRGQIMVFEQCSQEPPQPYYSTG